MKEVLFADTSYWVALIDPRDQWSQIANNLQRRVEAAQVVTSEDCLAELLNYFSGEGDLLRSRAWHWVRAASKNDRIEVVKRRGNDYELAVEFYGRRLDKGYSFVDCLSMLLMRKRRIRQALTSDGHFVQEGFAALLRD